ncbi:MAG: hypothetical protein QME46_10165 [Thermoanaerobacteraceae bacterium]|nr:hypothetical protein [Thermoanaerobacteraceae bacterium]
MMLKIAGAILIVASCSMGGVLYSNKYIYRLDNLKSLSICIEMLRSEIVYSHMPLPEASRIIGEKVKGPIADIFSDFADVLRSRKGYTAHQALEVALKNNAAKLSINEEEMDLFRTLGTMIGTSDTINQEKSLNLLSKQLELLINKAIKERDKNVKMYRNLGLLSGLGLAILLI